MSKTGIFSEKVAEQKDLALQLKIRVIETLAAKNIEKMCHRQSEVKKCASFRSGYDAPSIQNLFFHGHRKSIIVSS